MIDLCLHDLAEVTSGHLTYGAMPPLGGRLEPVRRIVTAPGQVASGDVYWLLDEAADNPAPAIMEAYARGAAGVVSRETTLEPWAGKFHLAVSDPRWALGQVARHQRGKFSGRVIAVAGDLWRRQTASLLRHVFASPSSSPTACRHDAWHVPLQLAELADDVDHGIVEFGPPADAPSPSLLARWTRADQLVVTDTIATRILGPLLTSRAGGAAVIAPDDDTELLAILKKHGVNSRRVGRSAASSVVARRVRALDGILQFNIEHQDFQVPVWGRHWLIPCLAAYAAARQEGLSAAEIAARWRVFRPSHDICRVVTSQSRTIVEHVADCGSVSIRAALPVLRDLPQPGRRIAICGELNWPANRPAAGLQSLGAAIVRAGGVDELLVTGSAASQLMHGARDAGLAAAATHHFSSADSLLDWLAATTAPGDVLFVSGAEHTRIVETLLETSAERPPEKQVA